MKVTTEDQLRAIYGKPNKFASMKVLPALEKHATNFINLSPFVLVSTFDKDGKVDISPKGGQPGFVTITNNNEIIIPDFKGNNLVDGLINLVQTGRIGLLFLIPAIDETLRVNGSATISNDPALLEQMKYGGKTPITCVIVRIEEVFLHCAKALMRSKLWHDDFRQNPKEFPSIGQMMKDQLKLKGEVESRENMAKRYQPDL